MVFTGCIGRRLYGYLAELVVVFTLCFLLRGGGGEVGVLEGAKMAVVPWDGLGLI
jgi:hypothetical protein